jgi:hypothetical protein
VLPPFFTPKESSCLLLVLGYNQPVDFAGAVPSTIFAFQQHHHHHHHHHLRYNDLIDCIILSSFAKQLFPGADEIVETTYALMTELSVSSLQHIGSY